MFCVGAVLSRRVIKGRERIELLLSMGVEQTVTGAGTHPASPCGPPFDSDVQLGHGHSPGALGEP